MDAGTLRWTRYEIVPLLSAAETDRWAADIRSSTLRAAAARPALIRPHARAGADVYASCLEKALCFYYFTIIRTNTVRPSHRLPPSRAVCWCRCLLRVPGEQRLPSSLAAVLFSAGSPGIAQILLHVLHLSSSAASLHLGHNPHVVGPASLHLSHTECPPDLRLEGLQARRAGWFGLATSSP